MKRNCPGKKANEAKEETQTEVREPLERSSRSRSMNMKNNIVNMRKVEVLNMGNPVEGDLFPEEEEETREVKLDVIPMENQGTSLGNVPREIKKEKVNLTFRKHREGMLKQKEQRMEHP